MLEVENSLRLTFGKPFGTRK